MAHISAVIPVYQEEQLNQGEEITVSTGTTKFQTGGGSPTCGLQVSTAIICSMAAVTPGPQPLSIDFIQEKNVEDVFDASDGLKMLRGDIWGLCSIAAVETEIVPYTDCADEGGNDDIDP